MNDYNNNKKPGNDSSGELGSWIGIIILMFVFWPLGLFMLLKKLGSYSKKPRSFEPRQNENAFGAGSSGAAQQTRKNAGRSQLEKKSGKFAATMLLLVSIVLLIAGVSTITDSAGMISAGMPPDLPSLGMGIFYSLGGLITFFARNIGTRRIRRYKKYNAQIGSREVVPIADIANASGISEKAVLRDIQAMIDAGYLGNFAYIDNGLNAVVLSAEAAEKMRDAARRAEDAARPAAPEKPENQYMAIIKELRDLNVTIEDIPISDKIDRIESLTAKIFRIVEENPAKLPQIRRFMNYYLPTTLKLLHSYATLEKQDVKGENITAAKQNIGDILEKLSTGFEQQLDLLFKDDAIDISADINVLEKMMKQDGLSGDNQEFKTMESGGI